MIESPSKGIEAVCVEVGMAAVREGSLSRNDLTLIGATIGGETNWKADMSRKLGCSKSLVSRYTDGTRLLKPHVSWDLEDLIIDKISRLGTLLSTNGLPHKDEKSTLDAQSLIGVAVRMLEGNKLSGRPTSARKNKTSLPRRTPL